MTATYLVFGDLHGRVLPAFKLAMAWERDHGVVVTGLLQVGDLGYFPDTSRLDKATARHAREDPMELGTLLVSEPSDEADEIFYGDQVPPECLWFTAGNHEDHEDLLNKRSGAGSHADSFVVDQYCRVRCIADGRVETIPGAVRVGALWGIDYESPRKRPKTPELARIRHKATVSLACSEFVVLLSHDGPRDAVFPEAGSQDITDILNTVQPAFAFFGHYHSKARQIDGNFGRTQVYHLVGLELRHKGGSAEKGGVGVLTWTGDEVTFEYLDSRWLRTFNRHNWRYR
ncbi:MAG: hypothetical protein ACFCD0_17185 [Gemmataceae bacterium]